MKYIKLLCTLLFVVSIYACDLSTPNAKSMPNATNQSSNSVEKQSTNTDRKYPKNPSGDAHHIIPPESQLIYTKHARCRMDCRGIDESEIREVLREGHVNYKKSKQNDQPCPTYAIEDQVASGQRLRIVFAKCDNVIKVITCIDLDLEVKCDCY